MAHYEVKRERKGYENFWENMLEENKQYKFKYLLRNTKLT